MTRYHIARGAAACKTHAAIGLDGFFLIFFLLFTVTAQVHAMGPKPPDTKLLQEIDDFGTNPGNLKMFAYIPEDIPDDAPLVVALHGCTQDALEYADRTEWNKLADQFKFYMVYPEQQRANNFNLCFNWFLVGDIEKGQGEALSIKQMVDKMISEHSIDQDKIYITGLSAGGFMTTVLLATYPEVCAGGAVMAGGPYRCATSVVEALSACMPGNVDKTPEQWGDLVRSASTNSNSIPSLSIFHGNQDNTVEDSNMDELVEQWTNVHQADQIPEVDEQFRGHAHKIYNDNNDKAIVEIFHLQGMGHAITVDPGNAEDQGGTLGAFSEDRDVYSSFYAARFWGLAP